jgi:hypothetical protein
MFVQLKVLSLRIFIFLNFYIIPLLLIFKTLFSNLGFNQTSNNYYLIIFILIILFKYHWFNLIILDFMYALFMMQLRHIK